MSASPIIVTCICGQRLSGAYNNTPLSFQIDLLYPGHLTFDASDSNPLTIQSLSAVYGITPSGYDIDNDGILTLQDTAPGRYTFNMIAQNDISQSYDVQITCLTYHPTTAPFIATTPTKRPSIRPNTDIVGSTRNPDTIGNSAPTSADNALLVVITVCVSLVTVLCLVMFVYYFCKNKRALVNQDTSSAKIGEHKTTSDTTMTPDTNMMTHANMMTADMLMAIALSNDPSLAANDGDGWQPPLNQDYRDHVDQRMQNVNVNQEYMAQFVLDWLTDTVGLPQYFDLLMENGYDSYKSLKSIKKETDLMSIGIKKRGHAAVMMAEIRELKNPEGGDDLMMFDTNSLPNTISPPKHNQVQNMVEKGDFPSSLPSLKPQSQSGDSMYDRYSMSKSTAFAVGLAKKGGHGRKSIDLSEMYNNGDIMEIGDTLCDQALAEEIEPGRNIADGDELALAARFAHRHRHRNADEMYTNEGPKPAIAMGAEKKVSRCADCSQVKQGKVYQANGQFYCYECFNYYQ